MNDIALEAMLALVFHSEHIVGDYEGNECIYCSSYTTNSDIHSVCDETCVVVRVNAELERLFPGIDLYEKYEAMKKNAERIEEIK